jgi:hypothetical protein
MKAYYRLAMRHHEGWISVDQTALRISKIRSVRHGCPPQSELGTCSPGCGAVAYVDGRITRSRNAVKLGGGGKVVGRW